VSERMRFKRVRECERERGYASAAAPLWLTLVLATAVNALRGEGSWVWTVWCALWLFQSAVAWWHYRDLLKRHDAARSGT
jgi:hypothetical protein